MKISLVNLILFGLLLVSFGTNIILYDEICDLTSHIEKTNIWISEGELNILKQEIDRLENTKYQIIP